MQAAAVTTLAESAYLLLPAEVSTFSAHCAADNVLGTRELLANGPRQPALGLVLGTTSEAQIHVGGMTRWDMTGTFPFSDIREMRP